jgi:hypothetical protein
MALDFDCGAAGAGVPEIVPVTVRWSWQRGEPFPGGTDEVAIAWQSQDADAGSRFALAESSLAHAPGIWQGGGSPSTELADNFVARYGSGRTFGVDLATQRFGPGEVSVRLQRASATPAPHGTLDVRGAYVHLGRWLALTPVNAGCQW